MIADELKEARYYYEYGYEYGYGLARISSSLKIRITNSTHARDDL